MLSTPCRIRKTHGCCFIFSLCLFLGKLHVMQQDRYSVWAQSTELEYCTITPPFLSVLLWRLLTPRKDYYQELLV